ncbi:lipase family protein [Streptomyces lydicus]|uniref:lipase family protein n=1 Tax=Streptomyces lydicus TaxID=47763 RepID=UPI0005244BEA|nr:lipase family protein [Streptomyces lydicus]MDC7336312.1 lipase family protein [Streptomyces lydicus]UEG94375.1 lipase family protein [Streptomyces lydicus]
MTSLTIDQKAIAYSVRHALCMARAAELAYKDEKAVEAAARDWGFDRVRHHHTEFRPPFPLEDTQAYTLGGRHMIIVAFRGTEPAKMIDWLSDATTPPWPGPGGKGYVHYGFGEALQSIWPQVRAAVDEFRDNNQTVWFTGHSLGGALAMLAGARLHFEEPHVTATGVYTFGQPRTCDRLLSQAFNSAFSDRMYRFVNNNDIVPQLPPEPFHHVSALRYIDAKGTIHNTMPLLTGLADRAKGFTADLLAPASDGVRDHFMHAYIDALEKNQN